MFGGGFPGFFGQHGMDEEGSDDNQEQREVDNKTLYKILGIEPQTKDTNEIKKAYRKACVKGEYRHPDKGGDQAKFKQLSEAYEILSNPEKKDLYDRGGMEAVEKDKQGGGGSGGFEDLFSFFGGGGGRGGSKKRGPVKGKAKLRKLDVTLEEVYKGKLITFDHQRYRNCSKCDGKGGSNVEKCSGCKGSGMKTKVIQRGFMQQIFQQPCDDCDGNGEQISKKDMCTECKGKKIRLEKAKIEVALQPGVPHDYDILYTGESDEGPGVLAGDLVVRIQIKENKEFIRKGADLFYIKKIGLGEALTGFNFTIKHLSGENLTITTAPGEVIHHQQFKKIKGKGMPFFKNEYDYGNLVIEFEVQFPVRKELSLEDIEALKKIIPGQKQQVTKSSQKPLILEEYSDDLLNTNPEGGQSKRRNSHDSEDEGRGHGGGAQCQAQ